MPDKLIKILFVSSEVAPFAKSGGLGDVSGSLPAALKRLGGQLVDIRVITPKYENINEEYLTDAEYLGYTGVNLAWRNQTASVFEKTTSDDIKIYFIQNDYYFGRSGLYGYQDDDERFAFFSKAVLEILPIIDFYPDIIHCNDWQSGPISMLLNDVYRGFTFYNNIKTVYTIHNIQYQGIFPKDALHTLGLSDYLLNTEGLEFYGKVNFMKAGLVSSDLITTVSKAYANEIQTPEFSFGLDGVLKKIGVSGIINGIDYTEFDPETDDKIAYNYSASNPENKKSNKKYLQKKLGLNESNVPLMAIISRLVNQKGIDLISDSIHDIMSKDVQMVVLGAGDGNYEHQFKEFEHWYPGRFSANIMFDVNLAQEIYAGSDFILMPSFFEPCGLGQIIAMRYGTIPIARRTGGLADTIEHFNSKTMTGNGFLFNDYLASGLIWAVNQALDIYSSNKIAFSKLVNNAMTTDYSWDNSAREYYKLYCSLV